MVKLIVLILTLPGFVTIMANPAKEVLNKEKNAGFTVNSKHYEILDEIIGRCSRNIQYNYPLTAENAYGILKTIGVTLNDMGFQTGKNLLLCRGLETKIIDCDNYCFLYLSVAEAQNIPLRVVNYPDHLFIRWPGIISWETTKNISFDERVLRNQIDPGLITRGIYLKELSKNELKAITYENIALAHFENDNFFEALSHYQKAIVLAPHHPSFYNNKGNAFASLGLLREALDSYFEALQLEPYNPFFNNNAGNIYLNLNQYDKAVFYYQQAKKLLPGHSIFYNNLAVALYRHGRFHEALSNLEKAIELNGRVSDYYTNQAIVYYLLGDREKAKKIYQKGKSVKTRKTRRRNGSIR